MEDNIYKRLLSASKRSVDRETKCKTEPRHKIKQTGKSIYNRASYSPKKFSGGNNTGILENLSVLEGFQENIKYI